MTIDDHELAANKARRDEPNYTVETLQILADLGLVELKLVKGQVTLRLTDAGRREALTCMGVCPACLHQIEAGQLEVISDDNGALSFRDTPGQK